MDKCYNKYRKEYRVKTLYRNNKTEIKFYNEKLFTNLFLRTPNKNDYTKFEKYNYKPYFFWCLFWFLLSLYDQFQKRIAPIKAHINGTILKWFWTILAMIIATIIGLFIEHHYFL